MGSHLGNHPQRPQAPRHLQVVCLIPLLHLRGL